MIKYKIKIEKNNDTNKLNIKFNKKIKIIWIQLILNLWEDRNADQSYCRYCTVLRIEVLMWK